MPPRVVRVGVVGTGFGARVVAPAFTAAGCAVVDVVSARDEAAVAALCGRDVDLICVHSPPFLHARHTEIALAAGRAVLCDKPFGTSAGQAAAMLRAAEAAGAVHLLNFEFRHEPARRRVKELVDRGEIGTVEHVAWSSWAAGWRTPLRRHGWLFEAEHGGGWIGAWGSHIVDMLRWLVGEVTDARAVRYLRIPDRPDREGVVHRGDVEDGFSAWLQLAGGATAAIDTSFVAGAASAPKATVIGTEGIIEVTSDRYIVVRRPDGSRDEEDLPRGEGDVHSGAMTAWAAEVRDAVTDGRQIAPSFADGLACARVLDQLKAGPLLVAP